MQRALVIAWVLSLGVTAGAAPVTVRDQRGAILSIPVPASKVVTFNSVLWLYLTVEQGTKPIAGASSSTVRNVTGGLLGKVFPQARKIPTDVSADGFFVPNVEAILLRRPDYVFQWVGRNDPAYLDPLDRAGLKVIALRQTQGEHDYFDTARLVGAVSGRQARVGPMIAAYRDSYAALDRDVAKVRAEKPRPRVLYLWKYRPLTPIDGKNFFSTLLGRSGGSNVAAELTRPNPVSMEKILVWNPDVVILFCCDRITPADLYKNPMWRPIKAIRNRRVYKVPAGGSRFADLIEGPLFSRWLAEILYPGLPPRLRGDLRRIFQSVYGLSLDDNALDETLHLSANARSAGYSRFARNRKSIMGHP